LLFRSVKKNQGKEGEKEGNMIVVDAKNGPLLKKNVPMPGRKRKQHDGGRGAKSEHVLHPHQKWEGRGKGQEGMP